MDLRTATVTLVGASVLLAGVGAVAWLASRTPKKPSTPRALKALAEGGFSFLRPGAKANGRLVLDNGTAEALTVRLGPEGAPVPVPSGEHVVVRVSWGPLPFTVTRPDGSELDRLEPAVDPDRTVIYNPQGAWRYGLERREYSSLPGVNGPLDTPPCGGLLLDVKADLLFEEPFPAKIEVQGGPPIGIRTRLTRVGPPDRSRVVRRLEGPWYAVVEGAGEGREVVVQPVGAIPLDLPVIVVDGADGRDRALEVDGVPVATLAAGTWLRLRTPPGERRLGVTAEVPTAHRLLLLRKYLWNPDGTARYTRERQDYALAPGGEERARPPGPEPVDGSGFFEVEDAFVFEPFPAVVRASSLSTQRTSRLTRPGRP